MTMMAAFLCHFTAMGTDDHKTVLQYKAEEKCDSHTHASMNTCVHTHILKYYAHTGRVNSYSIPPLVFSPYEYGLASWNINVTYDKKFTGFGNCCKSRCSFAEKWADIICLHRQRVSTCLSLTHLWFWSGNDMTLLGGIDKVHIVSDKRAADKQSVNVPLHRQCCAKTGLLMGLARQCSSQLHDITDRYGIFASWLLSASNTLQLLTKLTQFYRTQHVIFLVASVPCLRLAQYPAGACDLLLDRLQGKPASHGDWQPPFCWCTPVHMTPDIKTDDPQKHT